MAKIILFFLGPPGSGKGTQINLLSQKTGWKKISIGDLLRAEVVLKSKLGKQVEKLQKTGNLVPDKLLINLVSKSLNQKTNGLIFDGYPRDMGQLRSLLNIFKKYLKKNDQALTLLITINDKEVKQRLSQRRMCACGAVYHLKYNPPINKNICDICSKKLFIRNDDKLKVVEHRLKVYYKNIKPVLDYWQKIGKLIKINGEQNINKIHKDISAKLKELKLI